MEAIFGLVIVFLLVAILWQMCRYEQSQTDIHVHTHIWNHENPDDDNPARDWTQDGEEWKQDRALDEDDRC